MQHDPARDGLTRRRFLAASAALAAAPVTAGSPRPQPAERGRAQADRPRGAVRLFLAGDLMLGRGIDQIMPRSAAPVLYEPYIRDARQYVRLAEAANGAIPRNVAPGYVWGDALGELAALAPDLRLVNLETAVTARGTPWPDKGIHYRMHPDNTSLLRSAAIDCCVLANNHVLDWGYTGLEDSLRALGEAGLACAGAGMEASQAARSARLRTPGGSEVAVYGIASPTSGVPLSWAAGDHRPGVNLIGDDLDAAVARCVRSVGSRSPGQLVVVSIHWGGNWGHAIPAWQRRLAHGLIDSGVVDVAHGHSSHHPKAFEVYRGRLVLYGCGDLLNDYEGIRELGAFRADLGLMYFADLDPTDGRLLGLTLSPVRVRRLRLQRAAPAEADWLRTTLNRESRPFGTRLEPGPDGRLRLVSTD